MEAPSMDALEAILSRRVQRAFSDKPVEREKLSKIVEAGRHAMSARNMQPWQFVVIQNRDRLKEIGALCSTGRFVAESPSAIVVLKDVANARWADVDCAQAVQNIANAGWGIFPTPAVRLPRPKEPPAGEAAQTAKRDSAL